MSKHYVRDTSVSIMHLTRGPKAAITDQESVRKLAHVGLGVAFAYLGPVVGLMPTLGAAFALLVVFSLMRMLKRTTRLHLVSRPSHGELYFALGIIVTAILFLPDHSNAFRTGMVILAFADSSAVMVGRRWGRHDYTLWGAHKTFEGSFTCFAASSLIMGLSGLSLSTAFISAVAITLVEAGASHGSDNMVLPVVAALCYRFFS
jgi:phytol kinase